MQWSVVAAWQQLGTLVFMHSLAHCPLTSLHSLPPFPPPFYALTAPSLLVFLHLLPPFPSPFYALVASLPASLLCTRCLPSLLPYLHSLLPPSSYDEVSERREARGGRREREERGGALTAAKYLPALLTKLDSEPRSYRVPGPCMPIIDVSPLLPGVKLSMAQLYTGFVVNTP